MSRRIYGLALEGLSVDGRPVRAGVFDEHAVRAAAGLTMALGAVAFAQALLAREYLPIQVVTAFFFIEFSVRVALGLHRSPVGWLARVLTARRAPQWVSAQPKRFAWGLGMAMSLAMTLITQAGIRGALPLSICVLCLVLMWCEAVLGVCLGCELHAWLVRRGWITRRDDFEVCAGGVCEVKS